MGQITCMRSNTLGKKWVFLTLITTLLSLLILGLAILARDQESKESEAIIPTVAIFQRIHALEMSIEKSVQAVFSQSSAVTVAATQNQVIITQSLPNNLNETYRQELGRLSRFITENRSYLNLSADFTLSAGFNYTQDSFGSRVIMIRHSPSVASYELYFLSNQSNATIDIEQWSSGATSLSVIVESSTGWLRSESRDVNLSNPGSIELENLAGDLEISWDDDNLTIGSSAETLLFRLTASYSGNAPPVVFPSMLRFNFSQYGISKVSDVRVG